MIDDQSTEQIVAENVSDLLSMLDSIDDAENNDSPFIPIQNSCEYYEPLQIRNFFSEKSKQTSYFHINCRGLSANWNDLNDLLSECCGANSGFDIIGLTEVYRCSNDDRLHLPGYHDLVARVRDDDGRGGVGLFIKETMQYVIREDLSIFIPHVFESVFIEINPLSSKELVGIIYRPNTAPRADIDSFTNELDSIMDHINNEHKKA